MSDSDARGDWGPLAEGESRCRLEFPGAELLSQSNSLTESASGELVWRDERVYRGAQGSYLLTRLSRSSPGTGEELALYCGSSAEGLVEELRKQLGMSPGLVEVLGRAGIEIGLEPGEEIED